jgi:tRNA-2-methylthio-N6-dimethylallyladenosine synthase
MAKLFIKTYGCQMNVYDSAKMADLMHPHGFELSDNPEGSDLVILNTCHIREKASEKTYSELGRIRKEKEEKSAKGEKMIIAVAGCVAQAEGEEIVKRAPFVDIVVGPQSYHNLPELVEKVKRENKWAIELDFDSDSKFDVLPTEVSSQGISAFLTIQEGCDKFCHFCCVPFTRGAEFSRKIPEIYREALKMVNSGARDITLLGQNVSAFCTEFEGEKWGIGKLIKYLAKIDGIERLRYTTSHPVDMFDPDLLDAHQHEKKLMPYLHLPVQSGSNRILKAMNRKHDRDFYFKVIDKYREICPDIAFSSDFIVGYPGETESDFEDTLDLVQRVKYAQAYSFKYSIRPGTSAAALDNQIPENIKDIRLQRLQEVLNRQQLEFNKSFEGKEVEVLFDKPGRKQNQYQGKSPYMQSVVVESDQDILGKVMHVKVNRSTQNALIGTIAE